MQRSQHTVGRLAAIAIVLMLTASCGRGDLPEAPYFETLGFADSLDAVRAQVLGVYEAWQEDPLDAERNGRLGMHLSAYRKSAAAEILYRRARTLAPDEFRWTYYLAFTLLDMGRSDEATAMFREALKLRPQHAESLIQLAGLLFQAEETEESRELYEKIGIAYPDRVEGWLGLGKIHNRLGDSDAAVAALERAALVGPQFGEVHYALGQALRARGDREQAERQLAIYERYADVKIRAADELLLEVGGLNASDAPHMAQGRYHLEHAQFAEAAESFRAALAVNPANQDAWIDLVAAQAELGEVDAAGQTYRDALDTGIAYAPLHLAYGQALLDARRLDAAREAIRKAIELDPQSAAAYAALGRVEMLSGASAKAVEQFRSSLVERPGDRQVQFQLARALNAVGEHEAAASQLEPLLSEVTLDRSLTLKELALAYYGMGRQAEAIETLKEGREAAWRAANVRAADAIEELLEEWQ